jgi:hypothetical protein
MLLLLLLLLLRTSCASIYVQRMQLSLSAYKHWQLLGGKTSGPQARAHSLHASPVVNSVPGAAFGSVMKPPAQLVQLGW